MLRRIVLNCTPQLFTAMHNSALHYTALHCTAMHCTELYCNALNCNALHFIVDQSTAVLRTACPALVTWWGDGFVRQWRGGGYAGSTHLPHCSTIHYSALHCTALHCTALHCTALHYTALHCTALHCIEIHITPLHRNIVHCAFISALHYAVQSDFKPDYLIMTNFLTRAFNIYLGLLHRCPSKLVQIPDCSRHSWHTNSIQP